LIIEISEFEVEVTSGATVFIPNFVVVVHLVENVKADTQAT
jgi:hypothetical protein